MPSAVCYLKPLFVMEPKVLKDILPFVCHQTEMRASHEDVG